MARCNKSKIDSQTSIDRAEKYKLIQEKKSKQHKEVKDKLAEKLKQNLTRRKESKAK
ncbi:MAG: hypothetical protein AABY27_06740 [Pseudomonadota bacterium]